MANNFLTRVFGQQKKVEERSITYLPTTSLGLPYGSYSTAPISVQASMQLSAVYRCVDVISDAIASQSWEILRYDEKEGYVSDPFHYAYSILNLEPNPGMSKYMFMKTLIAKVLLEGNGFAVIHRNERGDPYALELVNDAVKMFVNNDGTVYYELTKDGVTRTIQGYDMIHILNYSYNGYIGVSTLTHAASSINLAYNSEKSASGFFSSGANMSGLLSVEGKLTPEKATQIKQSWAAAFDVSSGNPGGIAVMEKGLEFKPVTVNPKDAQMLETRQYNVVDICRFFGVSPSKVFDSNNLTYSNIEAFQLGFITDTISPFDCKIENEFNRKLFRPSERQITKLNLNLDELLRGNMDSKANFLSKMFATGGYTVNEIREELGLPKFDHENADTPLCQVNMQMINKFGQVTKTPAAPQPPVDDVAQNQPEEKKERNGKRN